MGLEISDWKSFPLIGERGLFKNVSFGKCAAVGVLVDGDVPYIGASNRNNGVLRYVADQEPSIVTQGNCIVFICNGQGSGGYSVYMPDDFIGSKDVKVGYNENLDRYTGTFLVTLLNRNRDIYGYGFTEKRTLKSMEKEVVPLPVCLDGSPDWDYMRRFMRAKMFEAEKRVNLFSGDENLAILVN